ncbi:MAG: L-2-amino-thiazoline-4-carboxylic acid hydrolase [Acidiferrobacterales bacterium]
MNPTLIKTIFRPTIKRAARAALVGRMRDRDSPDKGRFTRAEVDRILKQTWQSYDQLAPLVPREPKLGNRMNMLLACTSLAFFRVLLAADIEREYAISLFSDLAWKVYQTWGRLPIIVARVVTRDPRKRVRIAVNMFLRFPFTPPGYIFERLPSSDGISFDMQRCPVSEYFQKQEAPDLCVGTWCNLDYSLAEMWGGWLERSETLAAGCTRCDFRFKAKAGA